MKQIIFIEFFDCSIQNWQTFPNGLWLVKLTLIRDKVKEKPINQSINIYLLIKLKKNLKINHLFNYAD